MMRCILCRSKRIEIFNTLDAEQIISDWQVAFGIDIASELNGCKQIHRYQCLDCHLQFFPPELAGSACLYRELQQFDWYYMSRKWEHEAAAEHIFPGDRVLEVGCGVGEFVEWLSSTKNIEALGIELNINAVKEARSLNRSVTNQPLEVIANREKGTFDVVCSFQVLEHVSNPVDFLKQSLKLLKSGGRLIFCVPNADSFLKFEYNLLDLPPHHVMRWSSTSISNLTNLFNMELSRLRNEPLAEYHVNGYLNAHIERIQNHWLRTLLANPYTKRFLRHGLRHTKIRRLLRGQSIYACFNKD